MSGLQIKVLPRDAMPPYRLVDRVSNGLATFLLVATVLVIVFSATFPFDFSIPPQGLVATVQQQFDWRWMQWDPGNVDRTENIIFFLPFGFALAANVRPRRARIVWQVVAALFSSALLSMLVEQSQALISFRDPSLQDVWCNTLGGVLGAGFFALTGPRLIRLGAEGLLRLRAWATPTILGAALLLYVIAQLSAPLLAHHPGDLSVWDPGMPLNVGNAFSRPDERGLPWEGNVSQIVLADRAASADEATKLFGGASPTAVFGQSLLANYRLRGNVVQYPDLAGSLPVLIWLKNAPAEQTAGNAVNLGPDQWLSTKTAIAKAIYRIGQSSELSLMATVSAARPEQTGPARIVSIDTGRMFNLILGQEKTDLTLRLRTAIRSVPDLHVHGVFADSGVKQILVTAKEAQIVVYVDGIEEGRVEVTPEAKVIWRLYPRGGFRLRMEKYGFRSYAIIYRLLVFIPFAALLGAMLAASVWSWRNRMLVAVGATVVLAMALEIILGTETASGFQPKNLLISLLISFGALGAMKIRLRRGANRFTTPR